jgi:hypothetical protein
MSDHKLKHFDLTAGSFSVGPGTRQGTSSAAPPNPPLDASIAGKSSSHTYDPSSITAELQQLNLTKTEDDGDSKVGTAIDVVSPEVFTEKMAEIKEAIDARDAGCLLFSAWTNQKLGAKVHVWTKGGSEDADEDIVKPAHAAFSGYRVTDVLIRET